MRRTSLILVVLGAAACGGDETDAPPSPQDGSFSALTYNVAGLPQGLSSSEPEVFIPQISPLLNGYDVVLAQEDFSYHELLIADAEHPHKSTPKEFHVQIVDDGLNQLAQFPCTVFERVQWVECFGGASNGASDCLAEKGFTMCRMEVGDRVTIDVYNHHGEAGGGPEDDAARTAGFAQFAAYIQEHSAGHAVIVGGDTNLHFDEAEDIEILDDFTGKTGLVDVCPHLDCGDLDHIDRFFFRSSDRITIEPSDWAVATEFVDSSGMDLSDHPAIRSTFSWSYR